MIYFFKERVYIRNQVVYLEGDTNIDGIYFIKSGEFEVKKKTSSNNNKSSLIKQKYNKAKGL